MTSTQLATMSTALWVVATVSVFILLAEWSGGTSWGLTASIVRGVRGWADRQGQTGQIVSASAETLLPMRDPYASLRRSGDVRARGLVDEPASSELIDLGERRLLHR